MTDTARWFVCTTHWRQEKLALENLQRQRDRGVEAFLSMYLPMREQLVCPRGQPSRVVALPFFPRYLFLEADVSLPGWTALYSTRGIAGVLPTGRHATRVIERLVHDMRTKETSGFLKLSLDEIPCRWEPGQPVTWGAFEKAIFCERVDERRAMILVSVLGTDSTKIVDLKELEDPEHNGADLESRVVR